MARRTSSRCVQCSTVGPVEYCNLRFYVKSSQTDYKYVLCADCRRAFQRFLGENANYYRRSVFDHEMYWRDIVAEDR